MKYNLPTSEQSQHSFLSFNPAANMLASQRMLYLEPKTIDLLIRSSTLSPNKPLNLVWGLTKCSPRQPNLYFSFCLLFFSFWLQFLGTYLSWLPGKRHFSSNKTNDWMIYITYSFICWISSLLFSFPIFFFTLRIQREGRFYPWIGSSIYKGQCHSSST